MASEISGRYGEALFQLAREDSAVREMREEAMILRKEIADTPDLLIFFRAVQIPDTEKKEVIDRMFQGFTKHMRNFLKLLIDKDRTYYLKEILDTFIDRCNQELNIETAVVSSARALSETDLKRIREALEKKTGKEIVLTNVVDQSLIAGIKVTSGSTVTDVTTAHRINEMKDLLLRGGMG